MIPHVRLAYASTAIANPAHIRNNLLDIFESARQYNFNHQLTGVLLYGEGYFFQCIEGKQSQVDRLYQQLLKDPRHQDIKLLFYESVEQAQFGQWDLHYVHFESSIEQFFQKNQLATAFNPYVLSHSLIHSFLEILYIRGQNNPCEAKQALKALEAGQSAYVMSLNDMAMVAALILLVLLPLYLVVTLLPNNSGFFLF